MRRLRHRYGRTHLCRTGSDVQTLLFPRDRFTVAQAREWAHKHRWKIGDVDVKEHFIHIRQEDPRGFRRLRTVHLGGSGVLATVGWRVC